MMQPMDHGVLYNLKQRYKRLLLEMMILHEEIDRQTFDSFAKSLNIKDCIYLVANAWEQIRCSSLQKSWDPLLGPEVSDNDTDQNNPVPVCMNACSDFELEDGHLIQRMHDNNIMVTQEEADEWLNGDQFDPGFQRLSDEEIIAEVCGYQDELEDGEGESSDETPHLVSHKEVFEAFVVCMEWMEVMEQQEETTSQQLMLVQKLFLKNAAATKKVC